MSTAENIGSLGSAGLLDPLGNSRHAGREIPFPRLEAEWQYTPLSAVAEHIETDHAVIFRAAGRIERMLDTLVHHGDGRPELLLIHSQFELLARDLAQHMDREKGTIFPCIRAMEKQRELGEICDPLPFGGMARPLGRLTVEHERIAEQLRAIRELVSDGTPPRGTWLGPSGLYVSLKDLERKLGNCLELEDEVLFRRALQLQDRRAAGSQSDFAERV